MIDQTVRQLLFGPGRSCDTPSSAVPTMPISSARQRRKNSSGAKASKTTTSDTSSNDDAVDSDGIVLMATDTVVPFLINPSLLGVIKPVANGNTSTNTTQDELVL